MHHFTMLPDMTIRLLRVCYLVLSALVSSLHFDLSLGVACERVSTYNTSFINVFG